MNVHYYSSLILSPDSQYTNSSVRLKYMLILISVYTCYNIDQLAVFLRAKPKLFFTMLIALRKTLLIRSLRYICVKMIPPRVTAFPSVYTKEMSVAINTLKDVVLLHLENLPLLYLNLSKASLFS